MYNYISNYKGRTDLVDLYGDNSLLLYAVQLRYDIEDIISVASEALNDGSFFEEEKGKVNGDER